MDTNKISVGLLNLVPLDIALLIAQVLGSRKRFCFSRFFRSARFFRNARLFGYIAGFLGDSFLGVNRS